MWCAFSCLEQSAFLFTHSWAAAKHWIAVSTNRDSFIPRNCDLFHLSTSSTAVQTSFCCSYFYFWPPIMPACVFCPTARQYGLWKRGADEGILQDDDWHDRALHHAGAFALLLDRLSRHQHLLWWAAVTPQWPIFALAFVLHVALIGVLRGQARFAFFSKAFLFSVQENGVKWGWVRRAALLLAELRKICAPVSWSSHA